MAERSEEGSQERRRKVNVPKVRTVLKQIGDEITKEELEKLVFLAGDQIPKGKTQNMNSLSFFSLLEERQLIDTKQDDVEYLVELLSHLPRFDLMKKLKPDSNYTETRMVEVSSDAVVVNDTKTLEISVSNCSIKESKVNDGGFLQDPDLMQSMFLRYHDIVTELEKVTKEKAEASAVIVELKKKVNELQFEINQIRDDQNNLIKERNSALGAKSEYVFRESELRKELSDLKRTNNLLAKTCTKANSDMEAKDKEIAELKKFLEEMESENKELSRSLEAMKKCKDEIEEQLVKLQKDEEDNGRLKCKRCGLVYVEANNAVDACRYHSGKFDAVGAIKKKFEWSCCRNTNKNAPGCCKKKHLTIDYPLSPLQPERKFTM